MTPRRGGRRIRGWISRGYDSQSPLSLRVASSGATGQEYEAPSSRRTREAVQAASLSPSLVIERGLTRNCCCPRKHGGHL